jgi:hypothetical protein
MLNIHMAHIDWCKGVQDELRALRTELDALKKQRNRCTHGHLIMDGKQEGWRCYYCGEHADNIPGLRDTDLRGRS